MTTNEALKTLIEKTLAASTSEEFTLYVLRYEAEIESVEDFEAYVESFESFED